MGIGEVRGGNAPLSTYRQHQRNVKFPSESTAEQALPKGNETGKPVITKKEKQYFETLFPQAAQEIRPHQVYTQKGCKTVMPAGTIVDRKG